MRHCVAVDAGDPHVGDFLHELVGNVLGALTDEVQVLALAVRAQPRRVLTIVAIVTDELVYTPMECQCDVAVFAFDSFAARPAENELRKTAAVQKYDRLLATFVSFPDRLEK